MQEASLTNGLLINILRNVIISFTEDIEGKLMLIWFEQTDEVGCSNS